MNYPGYTNGAVTLAEGNSYSFDISNYIELPDGNYYYILVDVNSLKHFLPAEPYKHYKLEIGQSITCKVDRINCTGRIFIEPEHPFYIPGKSYNFTVIKSSNSGNSQIVVVHDIFNNEIELAIQNKLETNELTNKSILCNVIDIKKGLLTLELSE